MSSGNFVLLRYVPETTYGTTPSNSSNWQQVRYLSETITGTPSTEQSNEVRNDRQIGDQFKVSVEVGGGFSGELSYGTYDDLIEAALAGTWTSNVLKAGTDEYSFSIEKEFSDLATNKYIGYKGMRVNTMELAISYGSIVTVDFGFAGNNVVGSATSLVGTGSTTSPTTTRSLNSVNDVVMIEIDSAAYTGCLQSLNLSVNNNLRPAECVGSDFPSNQFYGTSSITGSLEVYLSKDGSDMDFYTDFVLNQTATDIKFKIQEGTATGDGSYEFWLPNVKFSGESPQGGGLDTDVIMSLDYQALYNSTEGTALQITRAVV